MNYSNRIRQYSISSRYGENENREWRRAGTGQIRRKLPGNRKAKTNSRRQACLGILIMLGIIAAITILLLSIFRKDPVVRRTCVPGFAGDRCERNDFLGTYSWSSSQFYSLDDGLLYNSGVAFRLYAPKATSVSLTCKPRGSTDRSYAML